MAAEFALDGDMGAFGEGAGEIGEFPEGHAPMPLGARFPRSGIVLPGRLGGERKKIAMLIALAAFLSASLPMKPIRVILLRYIRFSLFCPICLGHPKASGRGSQDKKLLFWGDRHHVT